MKKINLKKAGTSLLLASCTAIFSGNLLATELHYLVSTNNQPKGLLVLDIQENGQVVVKHHGLNSGDNLPFYADSKNFTLANYKNNSKIKTLSAITANKEEYTLHYNTNDALGKELLKKARVSSADQNDRAFIIDEQNRPTDNFPSGVVLNTEGLLVGLAQLSNKTGQQIYYYEPASNRFLRTFLESGTKETLADGKCQATSRLLRLDQKGQPNVPMINLAIGNNYALQATAASGAWSLQLVAAGTPKDYQLSIEDQVVKISTDYVKNYVSGASIDRSDLRVVRSNYITNHQLSYKVNEDTLEKIALNQLGINNTNIELKKSSSDYYFDLSIKNSCNALLTDLGNKIEDSLAFQVKNSQPSIDKVNVNLSASDTSCSNVNLEVTLNSKDLIHIHSNNSLLNQVLDGFSKTINIDRKMDITDTKLDKNNLTKTIKSKSSGTLNEAYLKDYIIYNLNINHQQKDQLSKILVKNEKNFVASVSKQNLFDSACSEQSIRLSTANNLQLTSSSNSNGLCHYEVSHNLSANNINQTIVDEFVASRPHLKILNNYPRLEGQHLIFSGVYGIEGEDNACQ